MTGIVCVLVCVFVLCYVMHASSLHGSGFLCRDPDTGKLHPVHSTWAATTFCGNYTCKIRKKMRNEAEYAPARALKVMNIDLISENDTSVNDTEKVVNDTDSNNKTVEQKSNIIINIDELNKKENVSSEDRLLTEDEIKTITQILHLVKKSDLDALIEIYRLAQEIYKEIDGQEETSTNIGNNYIDTPKLKAPYTKPYSYWYGPRKIATTYNNEDLKGQESTVSVLKFDAPAFKQPLNWSEFKRLSYIYPVSDFQRSSSYTRPTSVPAYIQTTPTKPKEEKQKIAQVPLQKLIRPQLYMPHPLSYIQNYNASNVYALLKYGSLNYNANAGPNFKQYYSSIPNAVLINPYLSFDIDNTGGDIIKRVVKSDDNIAKVDVKNSSLPAWQTPPLTKEVIDDIRSHNQVKTKILKPWRKSTKLERVGKVIQLEKVMRSKREILNVSGLDIETDSLSTTDKVTEVTSSKNIDVNEDVKEDNSLFELVIEKIVCSTNYSTPGYFRHGDISQPFPGCCPQRIDGR